MEDQNIRRGIDLANRLGESGIAHTLNKSFSWWSGGKLNKNSFLFIAVLSFIHLVIVYPVLWQDTTYTYASSSLSLLGELLQNIGIAKSVFFGFLTIVAVSFAPLNFYLFVRKMVLRHDLTALLATLIYILPNPLLNYDMSIASRFLAGDGAHAFVFSFIPLFLLYVHAYITTGVSAWWVMSIAGTAFVGIISPFAFFNLVIMFFVLAISDGFLGKLRIKVMRVVNIILYAFLISLFWHIPNIFTNPYVVDNINRALGKFWSVFPLAIPAIPVFGTIFFLVFDRREKLKPIFIGLSLLIIYYTLYYFSNNVGITGLFNAERYALELSFAMSFLLSILAVLFLEYMTRRYILTLKNKNVVYTSLFIGIVVIGGLIVVFIANIGTIHEAIDLQKEIIAQRKVPTALPILFQLSIPSILASVISLGTCVHIFRKLSNAPHVPTTDLVKV